MLIEANQTINPKLKELAQRTGGFGGNKGGRWGYGGGYGRREQTNGGGAQHRRFDNQKSYGGNYKKKGEENFLFL